MLVIAVVSDMSASLGAVLASAPTGTPLSLYLSTDGKEGLERRAAFLEFTAGSIQGCFGLLAFSLATRCVVLYWREALQCKLILCSWRWLCCIFCLCVYTIQISYSQLCPTRAITISYHQERQRNAEKLSLKYNKIFNSIAFGEKAILISNGVYEYVTQFLSLTRY